MNKYASCKSYAHINNDLITWLIEPPLELLFSAITPLRALDLNLGKPKLVTLIEITNFFFFVGTKVMRDFLKMED